MTVELAGSLVQGDQVLRRYVPLDVVGRRQDVAAAWGELAQPRLTSSTMRSLVPVIPCLMSMAPMNVTR
jgi:hypothetical protein